MFKDATIDIVQQYIQQGEKYNNPFSNNNKPQTCEQDIIVNHCVKIKLAKDGEEALQALARETFDAIIMDIMMPIMDGITSMVKIREQSNIPVILLTAKGEDTDKILGLNVGADDYVIKPFSPKELEARVKAVLRRTISKDVIIPGSSTATAAAAGGS